MIVKVPSFKRATGKGSRAINAYIECKLIHKALTQALDVNAVETDKAYKNMSGGDLGKARLILTDVMGA